MKRQNSSEPQPDDAPLYIRWSPDRSPYAIELRLELVPKILTALAEGEKLGIEVGGVLVGTFPDASLPTVRVEDIEMLPRDGKEGVAFLADIGQQAAFSQVRWAVRPRSTTALGLFRSQLRDGALRPSVADRNLLTNQFKEGMYGALLVQGAAPHAAAFFLATEGQLPDEPAVREFRFNEDEFRALPEVQPDARAEEQKGLSGARNKLRLYGIVLALLAIGLGACFLMWSFTQQPALPPWLGSSQQLQLAVTGNDHLLRISWNHAARQLEASSGATLVIADGATRREIKLGVDELRLGAVQYERTGAHVEVKMVIDTPNAPSSAESAEWDQQQPNGEARW